MKTSVVPNPQVLHTQSKKKIFFTIKPSTYVGFTHQLSTFNVYYKLGTHMGFEYLHTPFCSIRSSKNIYKFIGFNRHFNANENYLCSSFAYVVRTILFSYRYKIVILHLNDRAVAKASLNCFEDLLDHIRTVTNYAGRRPILVRFSGKIPKVYHWIYSNLGYPKPPVDLRSSYFSSRISEPWQSKFQPDSIKILIHIRQGDTSLIPTPWDTFIDTNHMREIKTNDLSETKFTDTSDYFHFLELLIDEINPRRYSVVVCSDGYKRGYNKIYKSKKILGLSADQVKQLKRVENSYEIEKFKPFANFSNCVSVIGESDSNLYDLIHSAMLADLIVVGDQQTMLPKLMMYYMDPLNPPFFVHIHNREKVYGYGSEIGLSATNIKLISMNIGKNNGLIKQISKDLVKKCA